MQLIVINRLTALIRDTLQKLCVYTYIYLFITYLFIYLFASESKINYLRKKIFQL